MSKRSRKRKLPEGEFTAHVEKLSHEGRGIAHTDDGITTFIFNALPDETVEFTYTYKKRHHAEGDAIRVLTPSLNRTTPQCPHYGTCGGCRLQHMTYETQVTHKQAIVADLLQRVAHLTPNAWLAPITADPWHYRHKARLGARYVFKHEETFVGFRQRFNTKIALLDACHILTPTLSALIPHFRALLTGMDAKDSIPQIEVAEGDNISAIIIRHLNDLSDADTERLKQFAITHNIHLYLQPKGIETVHLLYPQNTPERLYYSLPNYDLTLAFHPTDFTQINPNINRKMIERALLLLELTPEDNVLDLFCGLGNFTLPIAKHCKHVTGVEGSEEMVARGNENATTNNIANVDFHAANLFESFDDAPWCHPVDKLLIDPPRSGAENIVNHIDKLKPHAIVYISCNPATFARDAAILVQKGYTLEKTGIMDMFPQTEHVEVISLFLC